MNIQLSVSEQRYKDLLALQNRLGVHTIEDMTVHAWQVLRFILQGIDQESHTLSPAAIRWIANPALNSPPNEFSGDNQNVAFAEMDNRILKEIHRLLDDDCIDQAIKATQIFKLLKSKGMEHRLEAPVKSEMLLTAAETFAAESDPQKATQLIIDAGHEIPSHPHQKSEDAKRT